MFRCKDPFVTALAQHGYSIVRLPKSDLRPTQLLVKSKGELRRLGELETVFVTGQIPAPKPSLDNPAPNLSVSKSADLKIGFGLSLMSGLISALGGSTLGLSANYSKARSVSLEAADMRESNIELAALDQFLAAGDLNPFSRAVNEMLEDDDVYVVTSIIKSKTLVVDAKGNSGAGVDLDVPAISNAVGGKVSVKQTGSSASTLSYEGETPLAFGFQAVRLIFDNGSYRTMKAAEAGGIALEAVIAAGEPTGGHLLQVGGLVGSL